jgi:DNA invertase Pin-like site-specific DNA recombinase
LLRDRHARLRIFASFDREQADDGASLDVQQQQIMGYCLMKGYTLAEHFVERGVSGSAPLADWPEGKRLLATIGKGDVLVSAKLDRAFRSAADALATLEEFKDQAVDLHLIDLGGSVIANGMSKMVFTILAAVAEGERDRIRERIPRRQASPDRARDLQWRQAAVRRRHRPGWRDPAHGSQPGRDGGDRAHAGDAEGRRDLSGDRRRHRPRAEVGDADPGARGGMIRIAAANARGQAPGGPRLAEARAISHACLKAGAEAHADAVMPMIREAQAAGAKSLRQIAVALNGRGIATARGGKWEAQTVANILRRSAAEGVKLGGLNAKAVQNRDEAKARAEALRPIFVELTGKSSRAIAAELNARNVATPTGGKWHAETVLRVQRRLEAQNADN